MVVRLGAAICVAATMFGHLPAACAHGGVVARGSGSAKAFSIRRGANLHARALAHGRDGSLPRAREITGEKRTRRNAAERGAPVTGVASTYNPYRRGWREGGTSTASGERYDPASWTAAIQIGLRDKFGGVRHGRNYRPVYALVESADKQVIVKINDVGPLTPGRVIDLNERTMHYFDPTLERGLIRPVTVTPLPGTYWTPGPVRAIADNLSGAAAIEGAEQN